MIGTKYGIDLRLGYERELMGRFDFEIYKLLTDRNEDGNVPYWTWTSKLAQYAANLLADYLEADDDSKIIVVPCKVGDEVWSAEPFVDGQIRKGKVTVINIDSHGFCGFWASFHPEAVSAEFIQGEIGRTIFFSHEDAVAALGVKE